MRRVKLFDESHELDLEDEINQFLQGFTGVIYDIKYQVGLSKLNEEMEFCFSALIFYEEDA
jgi:Protein of unknown function (DUF2758).